MSIKKDCRDFWLSYRGLWEECIHALCGLVYSLASLLIGTLIILVSLSFVVLLLPFAIIGKLRKHWMGCKLGGIK